MLDTVCSLVLQVTLNSMSHLAVERLEKSILSSQSSRHENMKLTSQDSSSNPPYIKTAFAREL